MDEAKIHILAKVDGETSRTQAAMWPNSPYRQGTIKVVKSKQFPPGSVINFP